MNEDNVNIVCIIFKNIAICRIPYTPSIPNNSHFESYSGADCGQKASAAIVFINATETLRKKPHIFIKKTSVPLKMYLKRLAIL
jgi:hypothetical protein